MKLLKKLFSKITPKKLSKSYEGATTGRRLGSWGVTGAGPNAALTDSLANLRARSRDLARNNPFVANGFRSLSANLIGCGISPRWILEDAELKEKIQKSWVTWTDEADSDGRCDFYGLQLLVANTLMQSGEALVRLYPRRLQDDHSVPLQIQVLEPDFLVEQDQVLKNGNHLKMGIEFNPRGKRIAYHLHQTHPGESYLVNNNKTIRVLAQNILHIYRIDRPGQIRGVPWGSSVLLKLRELDQYEDAELVRKKTAALFAGFITEPAPEFGTKDEEYSELSSWDIFLFLDIVEISNW